MRILVISYYWPPAGGPGVQRWLKFCTYLPDYGITPVVYTPLNPTYPIVDDDLTAEVPETLKVLKQPIREPYKLGATLSKKTTKTLSKGIIDQQPSMLQKLLLFLRGNLFVPDARRAWVRPSVNYLKQVLGEQHFDAVITTGPPHSLHLIGKRLKKDLGIRWIADFRDPWTTIGYHKELRLLPWVAAKHKRLEAAVLGAADQIIVTSPTTREEFADLTDKPITVITNGYDLKNKPADLPPLDKKFSIVHIGSLLVKRNPEPLWKVLAELCDQIPEFKEDLVLKFAGVVADNVRQSLDRSGLTKQAKYLGYVGHSEAIALQHSAQVLLLLEIDAPNTRCILPGKLFEYMMAARPVLAIGPKGSDMATILEQTQSGKFFNPTEESSLKAHIKNAYTDYKAGKLQVSQKGIEKFERRALTGRLATFLKSETLTQS